jgi:hypothetical protein
MPRWFELSAWHQIEIAYDSTCFPHNGGKEFPKLLKESFSTVHLSNWRDSKGSAKDGGDKAPYLYAHR